ncbi:hypothetical protein A2U01_0071844, partial [Trifolium medium]|nr:hypothetical protein [Trifolium medium]
MDLLYMRAYIVAPDAGPKVLLMSLIEQPIKSDCQDLPLDRGESGYALLS